MSAPTSKKTSTKVGISINLLTKDAFLDSVVGKFLLWSLSIGRYLVIFTELIVILSFLSRFKLDRDLTDLNNKIEQQKTVIISYADTENRFNSARERIEVIKQNQDNQVGINSLAFLEKNIPIDVKINQISFQTKGWSMEGSALSAQSLKQTAEKIVGANPDATVSLSDVKLNSQTGTIDFGISISYKSTVTTSSKKSTKADL